MKVSTQLVGGVIAGLALMAAAFAAPPGMAPYPGQTSYTPPPAPPAPGQAAGPAAAPYPGGPAVAPVERRREACAWTRRINGWSPVDNRSMIVTQGRKKFLVTFFGDCPQQRHEMGLRFMRPRGTCLGAGDRIDFTDPYGGGYGNISAPCIVQKVEIYPDAQAAR